MKVKCYVCGRLMQPASIGFKNVTLNGWKCVCGEKILPAEELVRYEILAGKRKSAIRKITRSGDSLVVSIPKALLGALNLKKGSRVYFTKERNSLRLTPLPV